VGAAGHQFKIDSRGSGRQGPGAAAHVPRRQNVATKQSMGLPHGIAPLAQLPKILGCRDSQSRATRLEYLELAEFTLDPRKRGLVANALQDLTQYQICRLRGSTTRFHRSAHHASSRPTPLYLQPPCRTPGCEASQTRGVEITVPSDLAP
jgi:hypothetical protein